MTQATIFALNWSFALFRVSLLPKPDTDAGIATPRFATMIKGLAPETSSWSRYILSYFAFSPAYVQLL